MIRRGRSIGFKVALLALVLAIGIGACAPAEPVVRNVVTVGVSAGLTGPFATVGLPLNYGNLDYFKYLEEEGGIDGVHVKARWEDTKAIVPGCLSAHKRFKEASALVILQIASLGAATLAGQHQRDEIPCVFFAGGLEEASITRPLKWVFGAAPGWSEMGAAMLEYIKRDWTEERPPRVGFIVYDVASGRAVLEGAEYAPQAGVEFVGFEVVPLFGCIDTSVEWLRLAGKDPDWIIGLFSASVFVTLMKDSARLEIQKRGIRLANGAADEAALRVVGEDSEGWYTQNYFGPMAYDPRIFKFHSR